MNQHKQPCASCPFRRTSKRGDLGGGTTDQFIGQTEGGFWLPCHERYIEGDKRNPNNPQCAGAAIYRANCETPAYSPALLHLPKDEETVLGSHAEFLHHHDPQNCVSVAHATVALRVQTPAMSVNRELARAGVRIMVKLIEDPRIN